MGKGIEVLSIFGGGGSAADEDEASPKDMACKALWKAIKKDDYAAFKSALEDYLEYRGEDSGAEDDDADADDEASTKKPSKLFE